MNLLHLVLTFNLVTALLIMAGCFYLHLKYDERTESEAFTGAHLAGLGGVAISIGLLSTMAVLLT
jgi:hypothetical protein